MQVGHGDGVRGAHGAQQPEGQLRDVQVTLADQGRQLHQHLHQATHISNHDLFTFPDTFLTFE